MKHWLPVSFLIAFVLSPAICLGARVEAASTDVATVRDRFVHSVLPASDDAKAQIAAVGAKDAASLQLNGSWTDIDYVNQERSVWANSHHLERMLVMAKAARVERNSGHPDEVLEAKVLLALKWWTDHDYRNSNWWWNEIGVPELSGEIAMVMGPQMPPEAREQIITIMRRSVWQTWTGANLAWGTGIQVVRGCLEENPSTVAEAYSRMYREVKIVGPTEEGIEIDSSFHQHGMQLYNGGYGLSFSNDVGRFLAYAWGTRFQAPEDKLKIFTSFLLDGQQWMIRGTIFDYSAVGREITRKGKSAVPGDKTVGPVTPTGAPYGLANIAALLAAQPIPRQKEMAAFAARLAGKPGAAEFTGNKQFWCSDFMTHRRAGYSTSVRVLSRRMLNSELVNSEGRKSVHMSDGANFLYLTGNEYKDVFGVWDWSKIPGTTAIQGTLATGEKNPIHLFGSTTFDGGVSDGAYGLAAMDLKRGGLTAQKAWFFFDREYVALGAGITLLGDDTHPVATAVNQTLLQDEVQLSEGKGAVARMKFEAGHRVWVYHDHVGYIFAPHTMIDLSALHQTGAWSEIGTGSSTPESLPVFNLWIDHGLKATDASYEYTVVPAATAAEVAQLAAGPEVEILANTAKTQAVFHRGLKLAEIAFRTAGDLKTPLGAVTADHSCLLLVRQTAAGWKVTAANPENAPLTLHVTVAGHPGTIELPAGNLAGSSVTVDVK
jgi:chondroitin AC lyase